MDPLTGIIFSDLGQASSFMALAWVQDSLKEGLGYYPFPATLNLRPKAAHDSQIWRRAQSELAGVPLGPAANGFFPARVFPVAITGQAKGPVEGAVFLPEGK